MRILVAEDDFEISTLYRKALERRSHDVVLTSTGNACIQNYLDNLSNIITTIGPPSDAEIAPKIGSSVRSSYDVIILDYKMPGGINGMDVAKQILQINPHQRIIFASAYVKETLEESVKQLKQAVELLQKPFSLNLLVDTVEDKEAYDELKKLNMDVNRIRAAELSHEVITDLLERLNKIQKFRISDY